MNSLAPADIAANPEILTCPMTLPGLCATFRLMRGEDGELLGRYLEGLSQATRRLYAPHPFDMETGRRLCADLDYADTLRFAVQIGQGSKARFIAYFIVKLGTHEGDRRRYAERDLRLDEATTCSLAPSVADEHQSQGVGSAAMPLVLEAVRRLGCRRMILIGGTRAENRRAIHFYEKFGFRRAGDFRAGGTDNHDMILEL